MDATYQTFPKGDSGADSEKPGVGLNDPSHHRGSSWPHSVQPLDDDKKSVDASTRNWATLKAQLYTIDADDHDAVCDYLLDVGADADALFYFYSTLGGSDFLEKHSRSLVDEDPPWRRFAHGLIDFVDQHGASNLTANDVTDELQRIRQEIRVRSAAEFAEDLLGTYRDSFLAILQAQPVQALKWMRAAENALSSARAGALAIVKSPHPGMSTTGPSPSSAAAEDMHSEVQRLRRELSASRMAQSELQASFSEQLENLVEGTRAREAQSKRMVDQLFARVRDFENRDSADGPVAAATGKVKRQLEFDSADTSSNKKIFETPVSETPAEARNRIVARLTSALGHALETWAGPSKLDSLSSIPSSMRSPNVKSLIQRLPTAGEEGKSARKELSKRFTADRLLDPSLVPRPGETVLWSESRTAWLEYCLNYAFLVLSGCEDGEGALLCELVQRARERFVLDNDVRWKDLWGAATLSDFVLELDKLYSDPGCMAAEAQWSTAVSTASTALELYRNVKRLLIDDASRQRGRKLIVDFLTKIVSRRGPDSSIASGTILQLQQCSVQDSGSWEQVLSSAASVSMSLEQTEPPPPPLPRAAAAVGISGRSRDVTTTDYEDDCVTDSSRLKVSTDLRLEEGSMILQELVKLRESFAGASISPNVSPQTAAGVVTTPRQVAAAQPSTPAYDSSSMASAVQQAILALQGGTGRQPVDVYHLDSVYSFMLAGGHAEFSRLPPASGAVKVKGSDGTEIPLHGEDCAMCKKKGFTRFASHTEIAALAAQGQPASGIRAYHNAWTCRHTEPTVREEAARRSVAADVVERLLKKGRAAENKVNAGGAPSGNWA